MASAVGGTLRNEKARDRIGLLFFILFLLYFLKYYGIIQVPIVYPRKGGEIDCGRENYEVVGPDPQFVVFELDPQFFSKNKIK